MGSEGKAKVKSKKAKGNPRVDHRSNTVGRGTLFAFYLFTFTLGFRYLLSSSFSFACTIIQRSLVISSRVR